MLVVLGTLAIAILGAFALLRLPIDAVPDITNNQVQINTVYAALSPVEVEKQITFPVETALAGIPALLAVGDWSFSLVVYPVYIVLANSAVPLAIILGRVRNKRR